MPSWTVTSAITWHSKGSFFLNSGLGSQCLAMSPDGQLVYASVAQCKSVCICTYAHVHVCIIVHVTAYVPLSAYVWGWEDQVYLFSLLVYPLVLLNHKKCAL